jgi:catalase (peroxidase I)
MNLNHIAKKPFFDLFYRSPCMAQLLRLAYQDSGIFSRSGGSRALIHYKAELDRPENTGLQFAMEQIEELKEDGNHITALLSYSDLIQLGGYAAVEYTGGPSMVFRMGREDGEEKDIVNGDSNQDIIVKA